ncbi:MAG: hypothetical protein ACPG32_06245 [Akkermansiaceae bacterium]
MFNDLLTSAKGPGVIGTLLALVVLIGFGLLTMFASMPGTENTLANKIKDKEKSIASLTAREKNWQEKSIKYSQNRKAQEELNSKQSELKRRLATLEKEKGNVETSKAKIAELQVALESYKKKYRIAERASAVGDVLGTLTTKDGVTYNKVKILEVSALELRIRHENGSKRIHYEKLPDDLFDRFQFTKEDADAVVAKMQAHVKRSKQGEKEYKVSKEMIDLRTKISSHKEDIAKWTQTIQRNESTIQTNAAAAKTASERAQHYRDLYAKGRRGMTMDNAKKNERKADSLNKRSRYLQSSNAQMHQKIAKAQAEMTRWASELERLKNKK